MDHHQTILGVDPGTHEMGLAVIRGQELLAHGVRRLRNGERPYDVIGQARQHVLEFVADHRPQIVAIEKPLPIPTRRGAVLLVMAQELHARASELNLQVMELGPREVRQAVTGNSGAGKLDVAEALVTGEFPQLRKVVPRRPANWSLGLRPKEKYWLHMFDALGLAVAARKLAKGE